MIRKNILREFRHSWARFLSIVVLLGLGVFVLVGLKSTGPDMRATVTDQYQTQNLADAQIKATAGFTKANQNAIRKRSEVKAVTFGQMTAAVIKHRQTSVQILSQSQRISKATLTKGKMPTSDNQIALSSQLAQKYHVGQKITLVNDHNGTPSRIKRQTYTITGFVESSEYIKKDDLGTTNVGTGELTAFAVVPSSSFTTTTPNVARIKFSGVHGAAYSNTYENGVNRKVTALQPFLNKMARQQRHNLRTTLQQKLQPLETAQAQGLSTPAMVKQLAASKQKAAQIANVNVTIQGRNDYNSGYSQYGENAKRIDVLSDSFPIFFFAVTILVCFTTMS
ncbi:ABC superfamily ATP binding cassette transporter, membrane protein [Lactobacillus selangorensis]|uniref:ABC superfamily ATP binding cassette transporter, membrane protein n=1 Tax=Lactobacillus selangorensis TaxID=81857 RepID=A0A0R2FRB9_9LACO|nr:hypothetical protein [Lactobacillus selangorensis]KRN28147.1 ABC superfamily ATP binding cassette transporter, membrane protein [Lactobacillus selangorensis]KRN30977.1 ABC superfamily ATP binding cassette transporter, membrane protein [Lactobacillus selangorensis]